MKNYFLHLIVIISVFFIAPLQSQTFQCTDCPVDILDVQTVESTLSVAGLTNSQLNTGSQSICEVSVDFEHTWIPDITMVLIAPDGSSIFLIQDNSGGSTNSPFDITFLPCDCPVTPDPGASEVFNSGDFFSGSSFNGSYYPGDGCFSDLTGSANGDWILQVNDLVGADVGVINDWSITFCDSGTPDCSTLACEADLGDFGVQLYTVCDTDNTIELDPTVTGGQTSTDYATTWVISNNEGGFPGNIIGYSETADLTGFDGGSYFICPINYLLADESLLPAGNAGNDYSDLEDLILDGTICAELPEFDCSLVFIDECGCAAEAGNISISDLQYCEGESIILDPIVNDQNTDPEYAYTFTISNYNNGSIGTLEAYSDNADLTGFPVGQYWVCGLSYLVDDTGLLPVADGVNSTFDLQADIADGIICAELAAGCFVIDIQPAAEFPILEADDFVCTGDSSTVTITNYDPDATYTFEANSGPFSVFVFNNLPDLTFIIFSAFDVELCVTESSICGDLETCIEIPAINSSAGDFTIVGENETCPDNLLNYTVTGVGSSADDEWTISGDGSIVGSNTGNNVDVQIDAIPTTGSVELCVDVSEICGITQECITIEIIDNDDELTNTTFPDYCELNFDISVEVNNAEGSGTWSVINSPGPVDFDDINNSFTSITVSANGDYNLLFTSDCGESIAVDFTVWDALIAENVVVNCIGEEYTITFDISGGEPPYAVNSVPITGSTFTSDIISDDSYFFTISDNIACIDFTLAGDSDCNCDSDVGTFSNDTQVFCSTDDPIETALTITGGNNTADYATTWVIAENNIGSEGDILGYSETGDMTGYAPDTYYICALNYLITDVGELPAPNAGNDIDVITDLINDGTLCATFGFACAAVVIQDCSCEAEAGNINISQLQYCVTDNIELNPTINDQNEDPEYGYTFTISNYTSGSIGTLVSYSETADLTGLDAGFYWVCGLSYLLEDEGLLPVADGVNSNFDIQEDIADETICAELAAGCYIIEIQDAAELPILDFENEICVGQSSSVTVTNYDPNILYGITINSGAFAGLSTGFPTTTFTPSNDLDIEICITAFSICGDLESCANITVNGSSADDLMIDGPTALCVDESANYTLSGLGSSTIDGWTISGDGSIVGSNTGDNVDVQIDAIPTTGSVELCVDVSDDCGITQECLTINIIENELTNTSFSEFCEFDFFISVLVDGISDIGEWSIISAPGNITFDDINNSFTGITVDASGDYILEFTSECNQTIEVEFSVWEPITTENFEIVCNGNEYTITFDISGGEQPYIVDGLPIAGSNYSTGPITDDPYVIVISDFIACSEVTLTGDPDCNCDSDAGTINPQDLLISCEDATVTATNNGDAFLDSDDIGIWILYTDQSDPLNSIVLENTTGNFSFVAPLDYMTTYYIAYIVGNDIGGTVDLTDPCLDIADSTSIIFSEPFGLTGITVDPSNSCGSEFELTAIQDSPIAGNWGITSTPPGGNGILSNSNGLSTTVTLEGEGIYTVEYSTADGLCTATTDVMISGPEVPIATLLSTDCSSDNSTYQVTIDISGGTGPYLVDGTPFSGSTFTSTDIISGDSYSFVFTDSNGCESEATAGSFFCECESDAGNMPAELIEICGMQSVTSVNDGTENLDGDDALVYILHTNSGNTLGTILDENQTGIFSFLPTMSYEVTYYISAAVGNGTGSSVDLSDDCLNVASGQPVIWYQDIIINSLISDTEIGCEDFNITIDANTSIAGAWSVISSPTGSSVDFSEVGNITTVTVDVPGLYNLQYEITNGPCTAIENVSIILSEVPVISNIEYECDDPNENYQVSFDITGGTPPYTVNGMVITGSSFTSAATPNGVSTDYTVIDANGCESDAVTTNNDCSVDCTSDAGSMPNDIIELCYDETEGSISFQVDNNSDASLDGDDIGIYILHSGNQNTIQSPIAESSTGLFENFVPTTFNTTLYISYVVGNELNGSIDLSDPCLSVSVGQPIIFYLVPQVSFDNNVSVCRLTTTITYQSSISDNNNLDWNIISSPTGGSISFMETPTNEIDIEANIPGTYFISLTANNQNCNASDTISVEFRETPAVEAMADFVSCESEIEIFSTKSGGEGIWIIPTLPDLVFNVTPDSTFVDLDTFGIFEIIRSVTDNNCTTADTVEVEILPPSEFIITGFECDETNENYTLSYEIIGDNYPYTINGQTITEGTTINITAASGAEIDIVVLDNNMCEIYNNTISRSCECESTLGELTDAVYRVCIQDTLVITPPSFDLAEGDSLIYVMHEGNNVNIDNIVALSGNGEFVFDPTTMSTSGIIITSYMVTPVIYNGGEFTLATLDLPCTITTQGNPLFWYGPSVTSIPEQTIEICESETIMLPITHTGQVPLVANIETSNGQFFTLNFLEEGTQNIEVEVTESMTINIIQVNTTVLCENEFEGTTTINLISEPEIELVDGISVCNDPVEGETEVQLSDLIQSGDTSGTWTFDGATVNGTVSFEGSTPGDYEYIYTITNECGTTSESISITVNDCLQVDCPTEVILPLPEVCAGGSVNLNDYVLPEYIDQGFWTLVEGGVSIVVEIPDITFSTEAIGTTNFFYTLSGLPEECDSIFIDSVIVNQALSAGENINDINQYCEDNLSEINLFDLINDYDTGGTWMSNDNIAIDETAGIIDLNNLPVGTYVFDYIIGDDIPSCPTDISTVTIQIIDPPLLQFNITDPLCFAGTDGAVEILDENGNPLQSAYTILNNSNEEVIDLNSLSAGQYLFSSEYGDGCIFTTGFVVMDPLEIFLDLGVDIILQEGDTAVINSQTNLPNEEISLYEWIVNQSTVDAPTYESLILSPLNGSLVELSIIDDDGCIVSDDLLITVLTEEQPEVEVILANIFNSNSTGFGVEPFDKIQVVNTFNIYDRWGNLVFSAEDYDPSITNQKWDGNYNGNEAMSGVYVYLLNFIDSDSMEIIISGDVTLIR